MKINELCKKAHEISVSNGFWDGLIDTYTIPTKLALIHSEISEALEEDRIGSRKIGEELGDAVIRIADLAEFLGIDLEKEIERKMRINEKRPFKHGKRY